MTHTTQRTGTEYGVLLPNGTVHQGGLVTNRAAALERLARYRDFQYPDAQLVERTITYGDWQTTKEETP